MSSDPYPEHLDALRLFARDGSITATLPFARLHRFAEQLLDSDGSVAVNLHFGHDEEQRPLLSGSLRTEVKISCQRCMEPLELELECDVALLALASDDEVQALHSTDTALDAVIMHADTGFDVLAVIEDELLLSLPVVAVHEESDCSAALNAFRRKQEEAERAEEVAQNPFAVLAQLKRNDDPH